MKFVFELLRNEDIKACVKMIISTLGEQAKMYGDTHTMKKMVYGDHVMTMVAKEENEIMGCINGTLLGLPRITFLTVADEQSAREGLGGMLIDQFVNEIKRSSPTTKCVLHNEFADNFNAIGLYSIKGFKVTGYIKDSITARGVVFMEKAV